MSTVSLISDYPDDNHVTSNFAHAHIEYLLKRPVALGIEITRSTIGNK